MKLTTVSPTYAIFPENNPRVVISITCAKLEDAIKSAHSLGHTPCQVEDNYENKVYSLDEKGKVIKVRDK